MKVFISWSGERSNQVAELFKTWLKCVIQNSEPWVSSEDIENGSWWFNEIGNQLADTSIGVICLTKENKNKPWILFEAGALTKGLSTNRVTPLLIDLQSTDLTPPLSQLNATLPLKKGMHSLVRTINASLKDGALPFDVLEKVFETYWPQFEDGFNAILAGTNDAPEAEARDEKDMLREVLSTVRGFDKRIRDVEQGGRTVRYAGVVQAPSPQGAESILVTELAREAAERYFFLETKVDIIHIVNEMVAEHGTVNNYSEKQKRFLIESILNDLSTKRYNNLIILQRGNG